MQLVGFITSVEDTLWDKREEILRHFHSLAETANISLQTSLALALQTLDWLPTIPWDLSYCAGIPMMFAYGPELYELQSWSAAGDVNYLLDSCAQATNLLSRKLACMCDGAGPDDPSPSRAASPTSSAMLNSPTHSPTRSHSHSRTPSHETKMERSTPALCPAPAPRKLNQNLLQDQVVKTAMAVTTSQEGNKTNEEDRPILMAKPLGMGKAQMAEALTVKTPTAVVRLQIIMREPKNPTARLKGQMLRAVPAPQKLMVRFQLEWPHQQSTPSKEAKGSNPNSSQVLSLSNLYSKDTEEEWKVQGRKDAWLLDRNFGKWCDHMISKAHMNGTSMI